MLHGWGLQKRMAAEQLRALAEGAAFLVHTTSGACLQNLWLQCALLAFAIQNLLLRYLNNLGVAFCN